MNKFMKVLSSVPKKVALLAALFAVLSAIVCLLVIPSLADFPRQGSIYDWWRASNLYEQANLLRKQYKTDAAIEMYEKAIRTYPLDPRFQVGLGLSYMDKDKYEDATTAFRNAIRVDANSMDGWLRLSQVGLITNDLQTAHQAASQAVRLKEKEPVVQAQKALVWCEMGKLDEAEKIFNQSTMWGSQSPEFWLIAGKYHWRVGQPQRAEADFKQAIAIGPKNPDAYEWLGQLEFKGGKATAAETNLKKAVELNPNSPVKWRNLGDFYLSERQFEKAFDALKKASELNRSDVKCWRDLGKLSLNLKKFDAAEKELTKALELEPDHGPTVGLYVETLRQQKKYDRAEKTLKQYILTKHKFSAMLWTYLASIYEESGRPEQAAEAYNQALAADPSDSLKEYVIKRLSGQPADPSELEQKETPKEKRYSITSPPSIEEH
jgi:tetratricopeptide (TPR) repeat protein